MSNTSSKEPLSSSWMAENDDFSFPANDKERLATLEAHWNKALTGLPPHTCKTWFFDKIVVMHSQATRHYHTVVHLEEMLGYLELMNVDDKATEDYRVLALTVFFHDAVYDPKSSTNEEDSAKLFESFWYETHENGDEGNEVKDRVVRYIIATKSHTATEDDKCAQLLLDIDMAVLGKQRYAYWSYANMIRREYSFVEHDMYCEKRAQVLEGFLKEPSIFGTPEMKNALEQQARENLKAEIDSLKKGVIPGESTSDV